MGYVDLHVHTTASDGSKKPAEVAALAAQMGLTTIAITDHDTVAGVAEAATAGETLGVSVIPGIEISTQFEGTEIHLLGYYVSDGEDVIRDILDWSERERDSRNERMAAKLRADGYDITLEEMRRRYPGAVLGRPHFGKELVRKGYVPSVHTAFEEYIKEGAPYYVERSYLPFDRAVNAILSCGGAAVLAHPLQYHFPEEQLERFVKQAHEYGVCGLEVYYTGYTAERREHLKALAKPFGMIHTGGSDYHGDVKPDIQLGIGHGQLRVPEETVAALQACLG